MISIFSWKPLNPTLFSDAEGGKDQIQNVVGSGLAGEGVERPKSAVEVQQDHLVGNRVGVGLRGVGQRRSAAAMACWWRRLVSIPGSEAAPPVASARMRSRSAGMPSPVSAEVASAGNPPQSGSGRWFPSEPDRICSLPPARDGPQRRQAAPALLVVERLGGVQHHQHQRGVGQRLAATADAQLLGLSSVPRAPNPRATRPYPPAPAEFRPAKCAR
jgi:hypothetical protein